VGAAASDIAASAQRQGINSTRRRACNNDCVKKGNKSKVSLSFSLSRFQWRAEAPAAHTLRCVLCARRRRVIIIKQIYTGP